MRVLFACMSGWYHSARRMHLLCLLECGIVTNHPLESGEWCTGIVCDPSVDSKVQTSSRHLFIFFSFEGNMSILMMRTTLHQKQAWITSMRVTGLTTRRIPGTGLWTESMAAIDQQKVQV